MIGIAMFDLTAADATERAEAVERRRAYDWRKHEWIRLTQRQPRSGIADFTRLLHDTSIQREQDLITRLLQEDGIPIDPPKDWRPRRRD